MMYGPNQPAASNNVKDERAVYMTSSCGLWLEVREHPKSNDARQLQLESFLLGYASAYNMYVEGPRINGVRNVLHIDTYGQRAFLDQYCRQHPLDVFANAVDALVHDLDH